jgi:TonB family protein
LTASLTEMNIDSLKQTSKQFLSAIRARDWHQVVQILERKSPRNLFLRALLVGLILSVPWQCSRIIYQAYFSAKPEQTIDTSTSLTLPNFENGSVTNMPNPKARRPVPTTISAPQNEPQAKEALEDKPSTELVKQADHDAKVISQTIPKYPTSFFGKKQSGTVVLKVLVNEAGAPTEITIDKSSESKSLDRAARKAVSEWKFSPKIANGIAVPSEILIPIEFKSE